MESKEVAEIFREIARILEIKDANPFRVRAYARAAQNIEGLGDSLVKMAQDNTLTSIAGVGQDLAAKIKELVLTGELKYYEQLKKDTPGGLLDMLNISGLGPKTIKLIYSKLGIDSLEELAKAAARGDLSQLEGIKEKTEKNILRGIEIFKEGQRETDLWSALEAAESIVSQLKRLKEVDSIEAAGSLRRRKARVGDIDILAVSNKPEAVMDKFIGLDSVTEVLAKGHTKSSVVIDEPKIQVDLRVVDEKSYGAALVYFTGSKEFNIRLRQLAAREGYTINEYGAFLSNKKKDKKPLAGRTEESVFSLVGLDYIEPELREGRGEIEAALKHELPKLIEKKDIKGDLHVHSDYSDGKNNIEEIVYAAKEQGYEYIGIADHSQSLKIAGGLSSSELAKKIEAVRRLSSKTKGIKVLCGTEVDILSDGSLDYPDSLLKELDFVIAAIHSGFKQPKKKQTQRLVAACKNKYTNIIAHPTGVLKGMRDAYELDFQELFKAATDYGIALEINCHPRRMDLDDLRVMRARALGIKLFIGTDSHHISQLAYMGLGLSIARRGWLRKNDVINAMSKDKLIKWLKK